MTGASCGGTWTGAGKPRIRLYRSAVDRTTSKPWTLLTLLTATKDIDISEQASSPNSCSAGGSGAQLRCASNTWEPL
jgi:hypothetical protein